MTPKFAFITTCMGRLAHLQQAAANLMSDPRIGRDWVWIVVDFACPDKSGEWLTATYGDRVRVVNIEAEGDEEIIFNKPLALNTGAMNGLALGAEYLVFLDADTLVTSKFLDFIDAYASQDSFLVVRHYPAKRDLTGFLCVSHRAFVRVGGFDVAFKGWGAEDLELRLRLFLKGKLAFHELPHDYAASVPHSDELRTANYEERNKDLSHGINLNKLCANVFDWTGKHLAQHYKEDYGPHLRRLLGVESMSPQEMLIKP